MLKRHHILFIACFFMDMNVAGVTFAFSRRAAELGASSSALGWLGGVWIGSYGLTALFAGAWSDRWGRANISRFGCAVCAGSAVAYAYITALRPLLALSVVYGAGCACFWPAVIAWLGEDTKDSAELNTRLTNFSIAWNLGLVVGYGLTGWVYQHSPRGSFFIPAAVYGLVFGLVTVATKMTVTAGPAGHIVTPTPIPEGRGFRKCAWLANFALCFVNGGVNALFPQLATALHINADVHGAIAAFGRSATVAAFVALQFLVFWRTRLWPLWVAQALAVLALAWIAWADARWMFFAAFAVIGAVSSYTFQASVYFTMEEVIEKGKGVGVHEAVLGAGLFAGPLLAGWYGEHHSLRSPYLFCAAALTILIAAQMVLVIVRRRGKIAAS